MMLRRLSTLIAVAAFFATFHIGAHAEDCMRDPIYERNWNAVITTGARVRDIPCMETSKVLGTVPVNEVVHVVAETDGYYQIETASGLKGWSGQWLMSATDRPFSKSAPASPNLVCESTDILSDICGHLYEDSIRFLYDKQVIGGYPDGTFRPDATVNRAEFVKLISISVLGYRQEDDPLGSDALSLSGLSFRDLRSGDWFVPFVRKAVQSKLVAGYSGGTFKPSRTIVLSEAAKILSLAFDLKLGSVGSAWYKPYVEALQSQSAIPTSLKSLSQTVTRGEMAEMLARLMEKDTSKPSATFKM